MGKFTMRTIDRGPATKTTILILLALTVLMPWAYCQTNAPQPTAPQTAASQATAPTTTAPQTAAFPVTAPAATPQTNATPAIVTTVDEVTLDMVVRDKKNKPVLDLQPGDVTVSDNGSIVKLSDLRLVKGASTAEHLITLVFDRMEPSAANNARDIAGKILKMVPAQGFSFSVLGVQGRLRLFQGFTSDRVAVEKAIGAVSARDDKAKADAAALPEKTLIAVAQTGTDPSGARVSADERSVARVMLAALEESQRVVQDQHSQPSVAGLLALARTERQITGRKVVIYFVQGMQLDSNAKDMLPSIIGAANRAGVSIYPVDANAVDEQAGEGLVASAAIAAAAPSIRGAAAGPTTSGSGPATQTLPQLPAGMIAQIGDTVAKVEFDGLSGYKNPLAELAGGTGGAYIAASSGLKKPLQQMIEDMTTYYEASYVPPIQEYDGKFRQVAVRPLRKGLKIQSRAGYFAEPSGNTSGPRPFEMPLMKILGDAQLPADLKFRSGVLRLGDLPDGNANTLVVEVPLSELEMRQDPNADLFSAHVSIVAQIKNKDGIVLEHFGEDVPRHGALQSMDAARSEAITLQRHFIAGPGQYTLEAAILDRNNDKASAQRMDFEIVNPPAGPSLSDLALVRRTDPISAETDLLEPLRYENGRVVPDLSGRVPPEAKNISLFFMVHSDPQASEQPRLEMEVLRNGESVGHMPLQLRKSSGQAAIPYMASIRASSLAAGNYEAIASLTQGGKTNERRVSFRVDGPELASAGTIAGNSTGASSNDTSPVSDAKIESPAGESHESHRLIITALPENAAPPPTADELQTIIGEARSRALGYSAALPNFICVEVTDRSVDAAGTGKWRRRDTIAELLRYHDNAETRTTLEINGKRTTTERAGLKGPLSLGEFGGVLNAVFQPSSKADFQWKETDALGGGTVQVLSYRVSPQNSTWGLAGEANWKVDPAFHGLVYIDAATKGIRRITLEADDLPHDFLIHSASIVVDYDYIAIGTHDYLMPVRGSVSMREGKRQAVLNEMEFRSYRRYGSKVSIKFGGQPAH
jgi:VWFA-related protein